MLEVADEDVGLPIISVSPNFTEFPEAVIYSPSFVLFFILIKKSISSNDFFICFLFNS